MNKHLSQEEKNALASEFAYHGQKSGIIGGYCEADFPLYYANEEMAAMLGYGSVDELADAIGGKVAGTIHPDDMLQVEQDLGGRFYEGMTYETTYRMPRKDGSWFWTVDKGKVIRAEDGRLAILSICTDMSGFLQRQKELEAKNKVSDYLFKNLPGGYVRCSTDEDFSLLYISERFLEILGWTEQEIGTKFDNKFINLVHPEDRLILQKYTNLVLDSEIDTPLENATYRLLGKDGHHWILDATVKVAASGQTFLQCIISDINQFISEKIQREIQLQRSLAASEERYEIINALGNIYQELSVVDLNAQTYTIVSGYGASHQYQGRVGSLSELQQFILEQIIVPEQVEDAKAFLDFSTASDRLGNKPYIAHELQGQNHTWYLVSLIVKSRDTNGNITHLILAVRNIDNQKARESAYQKNLEDAATNARRANEAKTNFLRRMSHDIRTPLNGIIGLLKINETHFDDKELVRENQKKMEVAANHLLSLINDVLQMSKLEDGSAVLTHEFISLVDLTQDIVNIIIGRTVEAGIEWDYEKGKSVIPYPYIYGSPVHLRQIFLNIYGNCIKYNRPGGKIVTIVDTLGECDGVCTYRWTITDTGIGMSEEFLNHIFEPFAQEKSDARSAYQGTGLGMSIVKGLLDQMGGTISITSEVGIGSTFVIAIPFEIAPPPTEASVLPVATEHSLRGLHLMLAEDNDLNAEIAQTLLEDEGAAVTIVGDGKQAVELFSQSAPGTFDAILMDMMMPVMDGLAATRTIRALEHPDAKSIPIIAMTANAFKEDADKCLAASMNAHLAKPLDIRKVTTTIARLCYTTDTH